MERFAKHCHGADACENVSRRLIGVSTVEPLLSDLHGTGPWSKHKKKCISIKKAYKTYAAIKYVPRKLKIVIAANIAVLFAAIEIKALSGVGFIAHYYQSCRLLYCRLPS